MRKALFLFALMLSLTLVACGGGVSYPYEYDNGTVTSVETSGDNTIMHIEVDGYAPVPIKVKITLNAAGTITAFEVTEHMETFVPGGQLINNEDFINSLIANQTNLSAVDIVAGATLTAEALIDAVEVALTHFDKIN